MNDLVFSVGSSLCWVGNVVIQSGICFTQAHAFTAGHASFAIVGTFLFFYLMKRMARA